MSTPDTRIDWLAERHGGGAKVPASGSERLAEFMRKIASETYPEPISEMHSGLTRQAMDLVLAKMLTHPKPNLGELWHALDVGCGQGPALKLFRERLFTVEGIALNDADVRACRDQGFIVRKMDQNDLQFPDASFDLIWARHVLEHSIAPLWTLTEFHRVLRPGGWLYVEVPGPDTACNHESNQNHYSVLGARAWAHLLLKAGFTIEENFDFQIGTQAGPDVYFGFVGRKK